MIVGNDRNVTNRQFNNRLKKGLLSCRMELKCPVRTITNTSSNFEVEPLQSVAVRATSSIVSDVVVVFFLQNLNVTRLELRFARNNYYWALQLKQLVASS